MDAFETLGYHSSRAAAARDSEMVLGAAFRRLSRAPVTGDGMGAPPHETRPARQADRGDRRPVADRGGAAKNPLAAEPDAATAKFTVVGILAPTDIETDSSAYITLDAALD